MVYSSLRIAFCLVGGHCLRQLSVPRTYTLGDLHTIIQLAMVWRDYHLHDFEIGPFDYTSAIHKTELGPQATDEALIGLSSLLNPQRPTIFTYHYDYGDRWKLRISLDDISDSEHEMRQAMPKVYEPFPMADYPILIQGEGAAPPEDCGGTKGLDQLFRPVRTKEDRRARTWLREHYFGYWRTNWFPQRGINAALRRYFTAPNRNNPHLYLTCLQDIMPRFQDMADAA